MLRTDSLQYELPGRLLAIKPAEPRDAARLMVVPTGEDGSGGATRGATRSGEDPLAGVMHRHVRDLPEFLRGGDLLVLNTTKVLPARFLGVRDDTGAHVQGLFVASAGNPADLPAALWNVLLKMRRFKEGALVRLLGRAGERTDFLLRLMHRVGAAQSPDGGADGGGWIVRVENSVGQPVAADPMMVLEQVGLAPLPPYILSMRKHVTGSESGAPSAESSTAPPQFADEDDRAKYQTVYADAGQAASVAAPTAGLHFTRGLLETLRRMGVGIANVVLHVGLGTFKPVETDHVEEHVMHAEWCTLPEATARAIETTQRAGRRVIAVGTTTARTLESFDDLGSIQQDATKATRLLITPGYRFKHIDGLMTNFHLPRSTLLAMVAAFLEDKGSETAGGRAPAAMRDSHEPFPQPLVPGKGREEPAAVGTAAGVARLLALYREAIRLEYRFYSYGDAMLIV